jgi:AraC-like DNA-binding protein
VFRRPKKKPRTFTLAHRQRLERAAEHYLRFCYRQKTAARASEFATYIGRTPEYVSWLSRNAVGKSLRTFLREKQLAYAAQLLRTTPLTVEEIAERAGFGTAGTLYRSFATAYGLTPGAFRELKK